MTCDPASHINLIKATLKQDIGQDSRDMEAQH